MKATGGVWDHNDRQRFFLVKNPTKPIFGSRILCVLIAINELKSDFGYNALDTLIDGGHSVFLDSGVYAMASEYARSHECAVYEALSLAPEEIDGFDDLYDHYVAMMSRFGERAWGYIEIDQGNQEDKRRTRARLEGIGLRPIPVYHALNDDWAYFDELAQQYDRICVGNIVDATPPLRVRILATLAERRRDHPNLWIHALGISPNPVLLSLPVDSSDTSSWLTGVRWGRHLLRSAMEPLESLMLPSRYLNVADVPGDDLMGGHGLLAVCAFDMLAHQTVWSSHVERYAQLVSA